MDADQALLAHRVTDILRAVETERLADADELLKREFKWPVLAQLQLADRALSVGLLELAEEHLRAAIEVLGAEVKGSS
jgi:hypothetical protein